MMSEDLINYSFCGISYRQDLTAKAVPALPGSDQSQKCRAEACLGVQRGGVGSFMTLQR